MKSIMQNTKECYLCRKEADRGGYFGELTSKGLHRHHVMFGTANRRLAEKDGLWVYLCESRHHEHGPDSVHENHVVATILKREAQEMYESVHSHEEWMRRYGKNYL